MIKPYSVIHAVIPWYWFHTHVHTHAHTHTHIHVKYYLAMKMKEILAFVSTWMKPEVTMLKEKDK